MPDNSAALDKLIALKERILDLSKRNAMINSRFNPGGKKHFRIIDEIPQQIYEKLSASPMSFKHLPRLDEDPEDENDLEFQERLSISLLTDEEFLNKSENASDEDSKIILRELKDKIREELGWQPFEGRNTPLDKHAANHGLDPSYELKDSSDGNRRHTDNLIQTLFLEDQLNSFLQKLSRDFRSSQKERGINPLFFCFGFLKWKESVDSNEFFHSPLLMLPVQFDDSTQGTSLKVSSTGDDLALNQSLKEKIKKDFGATLPDLPDLEENEEFHNLKNFFDLIENFAEEKGWSLERWVSFGIYDAQNMPLYKDLENIENSGLEKFDLLREFLEGSDNEADQNRFADIYEVDTEENQQEIPALVTDADASQFSAVKDAVNGKSFVLKGPPGTGKSQTITNIITTLNALGKKVLFVAQKQAALDVVRNNLESIGAEDYLLEIFSLKANKKAVMESIRQRYEKQPPSPPRKLDEDIESLNKIKKDLNSYSNFINQEYEKTDKSIHEILWEQIDIDETLIESIEDIKIKSPETISDYELKADCENLKILREIINDQLQGINVYKSPLRKIKKASLTSDDIQDIKKETNKKGKEFIAAFDATENFINDKDFLKDIEISKILNNQAISNWFNSIPNSETKIILSVLLKLERPSDMNKYLDGTEDYNRKKAEYLFRKNSIKDYFDYEPSESVISLEEIRKASKELQNPSFLYFLNLEWWNSKKIFSNLRSSTFSEKVEAKKSGELLEELFVFFNTKTSVETKISGLKADLDDQLHLFRNFSEQITEDLLLKEKDTIEKAIKDLKGFNRNFLNFLIDEQDISSTYYDLISNLDSKFKNLCTLLLELDFDYEYPKNLPSLSSLSEFKKIISDLIINIDYLKDFNILRETENNFLNSKNVEKFYSSYTKSGSDINFITQAYEYFVRKAQKKHIEQNTVNELNKYNGSVINDMINKLSNLDEEVSKKYQSSVNRKLYSLEKHAPFGNHRGRVREKTGMGLIKHLTTVASPKMSIREFIENSQEALTWLKPCSLMSPLTVSSSLPLKELYDVVIIDEASQMKPEYALGAIARAKKAIIVGDPQQLPPTNFYQTATSEDEYDDDLSAESILDMAMTVFYPARELLWHYRSRHEDLIRFSNAKFYQNKLLVPVTANKEEANRGISYNYIQDGFYISGSGGGTGGVNPNEAKAIVDSAIAFMKERPNESLGIATMNLNQKEYIQNEFDLRSSGDQEVRNYLNYWEDEKEGLEEFFVKNLENVQGDERDVIMVGTLYGRADSDSRVLQRFGPINSKFGARRLNVLFTRAKNQLQLFTSLKASDILVDENTSKGKEVFRDYITYAESGVLEDFQANAREVESPFQEWAINIINSLPGYEAVHEIGTQGYSIDIGVKHEDYPYGFIMAVETDGATYHSTKSARDRDKLRQEILEGHGWVFHRIWSTDWINDPHRTREKLIQALDTRLNKLLEGIDAA